MYPLHWAAYLKHWTRVSFLVTFAPHLNVQQVSQWESDFCILVVFFPNFHCVFSDERRSKLKFISSSSKQTKSFVPDIVIASVMHWFELHWFVCTRRSHSCTTDHNQVISIYCKIEWLIGILGFWHTSELCHNHPLSLYFGVFRPSVEPLYVYSRPLKHLYYASPLLQLFVLPKLVVFLNF